MGLRTFILQKMAKSTISKNPEMNAILNKFTETGYYDASTESRKKANYCFNVVCNQVGCSNPNTKSLYEKLLDTKHYPMSLLAAYSFAVGEFLENPIFEPYNLNSEGAQNNYMSFKILFPEFSKFIESRHYGTEKVSVSILTSNLLEYFL